jgi:hypothetical protein
MARRKVIWSLNALRDLLEINAYYNYRNKSKIYSKKLNYEIKQRLQTLDLNIVLPQKTTVEKLFYFTHNHISVCFEINKNTLTVMLVIDERRSPELIEKLLKNIII